MAGTRDTIRTHVVLPADLVRDIDALVGPRQRSQFIAEAASERVRRAKLLAAAEAVAGSLADVDIPGWETSASTAEWVRRSRQADDEGLPWRAT
jgi:hypothetical protein